MAGDWTPYRGEDYLDAPALEAWLQATAEAFPHLIERRQIGQSRQGRPIWMLELSLGPRSLAERGLLWLDAGTHASEWTGVSALLYSLSRWIELLEANDPELTAWFSHHAVLLVPCISPDGYDALHRGAPYLRSSLRPPRHDAPRQGFDPSDIDGDGVVRWMRWRHPAGPLVQDEDLPLFMRPRTLDDDPRDAFFLCPEGAFIGWDGVSWSDARAMHGIDLNRNFPGNWQPFSMFGMDAGAYSASEPETRAVLDAFARYPHIGAALTYHTYTGCVLTQPYRRDSPLSESDIELMHLLAKELVRHTDYTVYKVFPDFMYHPDKPSPGVWSDTMATVFGVPAYTVEFWNPYAEAGVAIDKPAAFFTDPDPDKIKTLLTHFAALPGALTPWRPFTHPQLGEVEIGGIDYLRTIRNPPVALLARECERGHLMAERLRKALPEVRAELTATPLAGRCHQLTLTLENTGFLPTSGLSRGVDVAAAPPLTLELVCSANLTPRSSPAELHRRIPHLSGWGSALTGAARHAVYSSLGDHSPRVQVQWLVEGEGEIVVNVAAGRAGKQRLRCALDAPKPEP